MDCDKVSVVYIWAHCVATVYTSKIVYNLVHSWCKHWFKNMMISVDKLIRNWLTFIYSIGRHKGDTKPEEGFVLLFNVFLENISALFLKVLANFVFIFNTFKENYKRYFSCWVWEKPRESKRDFLGEERCVYPYICTSYDLSKLCDTFCNFVDLLNKLFL